MTLAADIENSSQARREVEPKLCSIIAVEGGICSRWKAARAGRNSDVTGESGGVSEGVEALPLECIVHCQVNATHLSKYLSICTYMVFGPKITKSLTGMFGCSVINIP